MEIGKPKVSIQLLLFFRQSGDVLFFLYGHRFRGYTEPLLIMISTIVLFCTFLASIYTFSLEVNIKVYTSSQGTNRETYFHD